MADLPDWMYPLADRLADVRADDLQGQLPPPSRTVRRSAVLILFADRPPSRGSALAEGEVSADVLLLQRAAMMRSHAGQPAFPGGGVEPADDGPVDTALREASEEVGLDPATVQVVSTMPALWLPPSSYLVTPVVGWWERPHPVTVADPAEVAKVERVPIAELVDPANRLRVRHPSGEYVGAAFRVRGMLVWGFTAALLAAVLELAGWDRPWDTERIEDLPAEDAELARRTRPPDAVS